MFKHMLCGVIVMTAGYVVCSEEQKVAPKVLQEIATIALTNPHVRDFVFPGRTCRGGVDTWFPIGPNDSNIPSWKSRSVKCFSTCDKNSCYE